MVRFQVDCADRHAWKRFTNALIAMPNGTGITVGEAEYHVSTPEETGNACPASTNKASAPGCKRCGGRVTHGGYCASCHESYYP
jgi:hypothetical protein